MTIKEIRMPEGFKDIDELIRSGTKVPDPVPYVRDPPKRMEQYEIDREAGRFSGPPPGFGGAT